uniref:Uncharacterized protein n=1 Tax=Arundo donax TaxID=35708 RepID=A0A0A9CLZ1_ARUDO
MIIPKTKTNTRRERICLASTSIYT